MQFSRISYYFETFDLKSKAVTMIYGQCNDPRIVANIAEAMQTNSNFMTKCGQRDILRVISCRGNMIVCVNCKANCPSSSLFPGNALVINACQQCTRTNTAAAAASIIGFQIVKVYLNPLIISLSTVSASTSSITVGVKISKPGVIHCASLLPGKKITSVLEIKLFGSQVLLTNSSVGNATMTGLGADTVYNVYCCAEDFSGNIMSLNETILHTVAVRTACCRTISLLSPLSQIEPTGLLSPDDQLSPISFSLNSYPTTVSFVTVAISTAICSGTTVALPGTNTTALSSTVKISPRTFVFYRNSSSLTASFVIRSITTGCYLLSISSRGSDKYKSFNSFLYCQSIEQPSVPRLQSIQLSSDGTNLLFLFDSDTNQGEKYITSTLYAFDCHILVFFPGSMNSSCVWKSYSQLSAIITSSIIVNVGDNAGIFGSRITAKCRLTDDCSSYSPCATSNVKILAPTISIRPTVYLSSSNGFQVNCNAVILDASQSTGAGVRDWYSIEWTVAVTDSGNSVLAPGIAKYLNQFSKLYGISNPITVPAALFEAVNAQFIFTLHLENFLMQSGYASVVTVISNSSVITASVRLVVPATGVYSGSPIRCIAIPTFPKCLSTTQLSTLTFNWQVFEGLTEIQGLTSIDPNPRVFSLTPYSLVAGYVYIIKVSMFSTTSATFSTSSSVVQIMIAGVVAVIQGGQSRRIAASEPLFLDGSNSFDKDSAAPSVSLVYRWSCIVQYPLFGSPCGNFTVSTSSILYIPSSAFSPGVYNITLLVRNPVLGTTSTAACQVFVISSAFPLPQVSISSIAARRNPNLPVIITGTIHSNSIYGLVNATWISSIGSRRLSSIATTPTSTFISMAHADLQLGLDINSLTVGVSYLFTLQASYLSRASAQSSSSIVLTINSPPRNGQLTMSPNSGFALTTMFSFTTSSWTDDPTDYPLQYVLGFFTSDPSEFIAVKSLNMISYAEAYVSPGLSSNNYAVFSVAQAVDSFSAEANISTSITVQPIIDSSVILSTMASALSAAYAAYDPAAVIGTISAAAGTLHPVDCTVSIDCTFLNRFLCSATANTCGSCLYGYVGPVGDSNIPCQLPSTIIGTGGYCESNSTCASGACLHSKCGDPSKLCPNHCSSKGTCIYTDVKNQVVSKCSQSNVHCRATCQCVTGSYGADCSMSLLKYNQNVKFNELACSNLANVVHMQASSTDVVLAMATAISQVFSDVTTISRSAITNCTAALVGTVLSNPMVSCERETQLAILRSFSELLDTGTLFPSSLYTAVAGCISKLAVSCQQNMAVSQTPVLVVEKNIRMQTVLQPVSAAVTGVYCPPVSTYLKLVGASVGSITLSSAFLKNDSNTIKAVGITVIEYVTNPQRLPVNASIIRLESSYYKFPQSSSQLRRKLSTQQSNVSPFVVTITLPNNDRTVFKSKQVINETYVCTKFMKTPTLACSGTVELNVSCPVNMRGYFIVQCPTYSTRPVCLFWNENQQLNGGCTLVAYNRVNTTCRCTQKVLLFSADPLTIIQEFSVGMTTVTYDAIVVFIAYPPEEQVKKNEVVLPFIYAIGSLLIVVAGVLLRIDIGEMSKTKKRSQYESHKSIRTIAGLFSSIVPEKYKSEHLNKLTLRNALELHRWTRVFYVDIRIFPWFAVSITTMSTISLTIAFISLICPDDGSCESISTRSSCEYAGHNRIIGFDVHYCGWNAHTRSCGYSSDAFFNPTFIFVVDLFLLIAVNSVSKLSELSLMHHPFLSTKTTRGLQNTKSKLTSIAVDVEEFPVEGNGSSKQSPQAEQRPFKYDEFCEWNSLPLSVLRAARLEKANRAMDSVQLLEEADNVYFSALARRQEMAVTKASRRILLNSLKNEKRMLTYECPPNGRAIVKQVLAARQAAISLSRDISNLKAEDKEMHILKYCIIHILRGGYQRAFAKKVISFPGKDYYHHSAISFCLFAFVVALVAAMVCSIVFLETKVGTRATNIFFTIALTIIAQDVFIVQPVSLWVEWYGIRRPLAYELNNLVAHLRRRVKLVLSRRRGLLRDYGSFVQHFNPACRVARLNAALPVAKFLFSLGDYDIPLRIVSTSTTMWSWFTKDTYFRPLLMLEYLCDPIKELAIIVCVTLATNLFYIAMVQLIQSSLPSGVAWGIFSIVLFLLVVVLSIMVVMNSQGATGDDKKHQARVEAELLFSEIDKDSVVEEQQHWQRQRQPSSPEVASPTAANQHMVNHRHIPDDQYQEEEEEEDTAEVKLDIIDERNLLTTALSFSKPRHSNLKLASAVQYQNQRNVMNSSKNLHVPKRKHHKDRKNREDLKWTVRSKLAVETDLGHRPVEDLPVLSEIPVVEQQQHHHLYGVEVVLDREEGDSPDTYRRSVSSRAVRSRYKSNLQDNFPHHEQKTSEDLKWSKMVVDSGPGHRGEELFLSEIPIPTVEQQHLHEDEMVLEREEGGSPDTSRRTVSSRAGRSRSSRYKSNIRDNFHSSSRHSGPGKSINVDSSMTISSPKFPTWN